MWDRVKINYSGHVLCEDFVSMSHGCVAHFNSFWTVMELNGTEEKLCQALAVRFALLLQNVDSNVPSFVF